MYGRILLAVTIWTTTGLLFAQTPAKENAAAVWLASYEKLGGKASLTVSEEGEVILAIQKRKAQKPLVSLKALKLGAGVRIVGLQGFEIDDDDLEALATWKEL